MSRGSAQRPLDALLWQGDGSVIAGLREVLEGMQPGGKRRALIPPSAGYLEEGLEPQVSLYWKNRDRDSLPNNPGFHWY